LRTVRGEFKKKIVGLEVRKGDTKCLCGGAWIRHHTGGGLIPDRDQEMALKRPGEKVGPRDNPQQPYRYFSREKGGGSHKNGKTYWNHRNFTSQINGKGGCASLD